METLNQLRRDPVTGIWTIVVQRGKPLAALKPKQSPKAQNPDPNESCLYCEGHEHETPPEIFAIRDHSAAKNKPGWRVRCVPENDPVLQIHGELNNRGIGIYDMFDGIGAHEVVIESPHHHRSLIDLTAPELTNVLTAYRERELDLKRDFRFRYILIRKSGSDGDESTTRHAFSHVLATPITPGRVREELQNAQQYYALKERCLFCDVIRQEREDELRVAAENAQFIALCPFAARSPFEIWILPKQHETFFEWSNDLEPLANTMQDLFRRLKHLLGPYQLFMEVHSGPNLSAGKKRGYWKTVERDFHWHIEIAPIIGSYSANEMSQSFHINWLAPEQCRELLVAAVEA